MSLYICVIFSAFFNGCTMDVVYSGHPIDYIIIGTILLGTPAIGIYYALSGRQQPTTSEYLQGNRNFHWVPVSISMTASFYSAILMLGSPAESYLHGAVFLFYGIGLIIGILLSITLYLPVFHPLSLTSVNDVSDAPFVISSLDSIQ